MNASLFTVILILAPVYRSGTVRFEDVKHDEQVRPRRQHVHPQRTAAAGEVARRGAKLQTMTLSSESFGARTSFEA